MSDKDQMAGSACRQLPGDEHSQRVMRQRAERLAKGLRRTKEGLAETRYICLSFNGLGKYAVVKQRVEEVILSRGMAPVPCAPAHIAGVVSLRGRLITVLDLSALMGLGQMADYRQKPVLIVNNRGMSLGLIADEIEGEGSFREGELEAPFNSVIDTSFIVGIHLSSIALLDMEILLDEQRIAVNE